MILKSWFLIKSGYYKERKLFKGGNYMRKIWYVFLKENYIKKNYSVFDTVK